MATKKKAIMIMYDTLCRNFLQPYGCDWVHTPNFQRLAKKAVTFDTNYVNSLPCMPARRDLHNSRINFLQRDWGPLEPYDDSMPEELKKHGIYSCLVSDHYHYWEDGGCTYHNRYSSWTANRGQEGDAFFGHRSMVDAINELGEQVTDPRTGQMLSKKQDACNRTLQTKESDMPQAKTFSDGLAFIRENHDAASWFLQIETFDPHEPFFTQPKWKELYPELADYMGKKTDWPEYDPVREHETTEDIAYVRRLYAAIVSMCDGYLGKVLDAMDEYNLWEDTLLIVNTDHGFLLGEHDWWGKSIMPAYEEISHTPLFVYDPVSKLAGTRRSQLTCAIDLPVTVLDYFGLAIPADMQGKSLLPVIRENAAGHDAVLFGFHASHVAVTDGRFTYFRAPLAEQVNNCYDYTLMPTRMRNRFSVSDLQKAVLAEPMANTKGCPVLKTPAQICYVNPVNFGTKLFDLSTDPEQKHPLEQPELEAKMANLLITKMKEANAPAEQFTRLGLHPDSDMTPEDITVIRQADDRAQTPSILPDTLWLQEAKNAFRVIRQMMPPQAVEGLGSILPMVRMGREQEPVSLKDIIAALKQMLPPERQQQMLYYMLLVSRAY